MHPVPARTATAVTFVTAAVFALLAFVGPAVASAMTIDPPNPVAGDTVTATDTRFSECPAGTTASFHFTFTADASGTVVASGTSTSRSYPTTISQPGGYTVTDHAQCSDGSNASDDTGNFTVRNALSGSISVSPDPPVVNQPATLSAAASGGNPGYTFSWDLNNDGQFDDATTRTVNTTFSTTGSHVVKVRITDTGQGGNPAHTTTITRTINVVASSGSPPPPPPPCIHTVRFKLSEFTTEGCFKQTSSSPARWETTSAIKLNGITLPDYGQTFTITGPTAADPGGHFTAADSTLQLDRFTAFSGNIDWSLPDGGSGDKKELRSFSVATGAHLLGFRARGLVKLELGERTDGTYYAVFSLNLELPAQFTTGPDPSFGSASGGVSLLVDEKGIHYGGLKVEAHDVWLNKLKVDSVCFSYIPSGGTSTVPCDPPSFGPSSNLTPKLNGDEPFVTCNPPDSNTDRWDGSAVFDLPSHLQLGAFGGVADGQISKLGGSIGDLGRRVPLAEGLYLDHVSFGLCLSPPPFKIRANVGANFLGSNHLVSIDGGFTYTDAYRFQPWDLELDGGVSVADVPVGQGTFGINGAQLIRFSVQAGVNIEDVVSLNGSVSGWVDAPHGNYLVAGEAQACVFGPCLTGEGEISSVGLAGCIQVGSTSPGIDLVIPLDGSAPHLGGAFYPISAGFGYRWGASSPDVLGNSCDFSSYQPTLPVTASAARAGRPLRLRIARGTRAVTLRIHGSHGPPKVVLRGPGGVTVASPAHARGVLRKGHYLIAENKANGTTNVLLLHPAAGTWTVTRAPGSRSEPTTIDRANLQPPPAVGARVFGKGVTRTLRVAYALPAGATLRLVEHGKRALHTIAAHVVGRRCPHLPKRAPGTGQRILCATIRFRPSRGPGGLRKVQAVVTRGGLPLLQKDVASFRAPRQILPTPVRAVRVSRSGSSLLVVFSPSRGASRYAVSATLSDGRALGFYLPASCRALRISHVSRKLAAVIRVGGVRYDYAVGRVRKIAIRARARSAGSRSKRFGFGRVCRRPGARFTG